MAHSRRNYDEREYKLLQDGWRLHGENWNSIQQMGLKGRDSTAVGQKIRGLLREGLLPSDHVQTPSSSENFLLSSKLVKNSKNREIPTEVFVNTAIQGGISQIFL